MPTKTEQRTVTIVGWIWLAAMILALAFDGSLALAILSGLGIAAVSLYLGYKYFRDPKLFRRNGR